MARTYVDYSKDDKSSTKAMNDIRGFIGKGQKFEQFIIIATTGFLHAKDMSSFRVLCSFAGIEGFPVRVLADYIAGILKVDKLEEPTDE